MAHFTKDIINLGLPMIWLGLNALGIGLGSASVAAMLALIAWYGECKHGMNLAGTNFSCNSMATKVGTDANAALVGWRLVFGGYVAADPVQPHSALFAMKAIYLYLPVLLTAAALIITTSLNVEHKIPEIRKELAARKGITAA